MSVNKVLEEVNKLTASFQKQREELVAKLKPSFHGIFKPYLEKHPSVSAVYFTAYTPYFNDGDECTFSVHELMGIIVDEDGNELDEEFGAYGYSEQEYNDLADFLETGVASEVLKNKYEYSFKPFRSEWDTQSRKYIRIPIESPYATIEDCVRDRASSDLELGAEKLRALGRAVADWDSVSNVLAKIPDDIIRDLFGDHIKVVITLDGVEVEEYDHD